MINKEQQLAVLRLFRSYVGSDDGSRLSSAELDKLNEYTMSKGVVFENLSCILSQEIIDSAISLYGKDGDEWNKTFHKSFNTVISTDESILIFQQLVHYITTYGFSRLGIYDDNTVYIPKEQLEIPELDIENIKLSVIHCINKSDISGKLKELLSSSIALSKDTINDIMTLSDFIDKESINDITNKEVRIAMYSKYDLCPKNNLEFLRYLIYKTTSQTLLIKNKHLFNLIKNCDKQAACYLFDLYFNSFNDNDGIVQLSKLAYRYKMLFLAFKTKFPYNSYEKRLNKYINRIYKLSKTTHTAAPKDILNNLSNMPYNVFSLISKQVYDELDKITIFKEISILNGLKYRLSDPTSIVYKVRNGKGYVQSDISISDNKSTNIQKIYDEVYNHLICRMSKLVSGKNIYATNEYNYAAPTSEKMFCGNIPCGTYIEVPRENNMIFGISWKDVDNCQVDLDIHAQNKDVHYGWNAYYKSESNDIGYSGDVTSAPNGATELFYVSHTSKCNSYLITVNKYTSPNADIPFNLVIAKCDDASIKSNYVIDPNNIFASIPFKFTLDNEAFHQMTLGYVRVLENSIRFYFNNFDSGTTITSSNSKLLQGVYEYLEKYSDTQLKLLDILKDAGANIVTQLNKVEYKPVTVNGNVLYDKVVTNITPDIDLSFDKLDKTTIIDIFKK